MCHIPIILQYVSRSVRIYGLYVPKKTIVSHMCVQYVPNFIAICSQYFFQYDNM